MKTLKRSFPGFKKTGQEFRKSKLTYNGEQGTYLKHLFCTGLNTCKSRETQFICSSGNKSFQNKWQLFCFRRQKERNIFERASVPQLLTSSEAARVEYRNEIC